MIQSAMELLGVVVFRFRPLARVWAIALILVNLGALFFLNTLYGQIALGAVLAGILVMIVIHNRLGFVRLLGIGHIFWIPMIAWFVLSPPGPESRALVVWLCILIAFNSISLVIDAVDVIRYLRGERTPHYRW